MPADVRQTPRFYSHALVLVALIATGARADEARIPPPSEQAADILISGRSFSATHVDVANVGQSLPQTLAGIKLTNTQGFSWYVSRHYAMKTDAGDSAAGDYLRLLECAYPYYAWFFGAEPAGIDRKRMAVVFGKEKKSLERALKSDDIKWDFGGGGITYEHIHIAYAYPSGSLDYHRRYILLHECVHLYQMCFTGNCDNTPLWFCEGIADAISSHVYDSRTRRITLDVFDKATPPNFLDDGLAALRHKPQSIRQIDRDTKAIRGVGFLLVQFLRSTPDKERRFRLWCNEIMKGPYRANTDAAAIADREAALVKIYGPLDQLDAEFAVWCKARRNTFHYAEWGWEQNGNTLAAYGFATGGKLSETDVLLPPGEKPSDDPWRLDYAADPLPPTVGPVARGVEEPSVGALLDFSEDPHRGVAGIGLGVMSPSENATDGLRPDHASQFKILVREGRFLDIDGSDLFLKPISLKIADDVRSAMDADKCRIGLTVTIAKTELRLSLRAKNPLDPHFREFVTSMPIDQAVRERLLKQRLSVLARDGWQRVTPFFDDGRRAEADSLAPSPIGRWSATTGGK